MEATHKIKIKIGNAEFEAEGPPDLVKAQFAEFMKAVAQLAPSVAAPAPAVHAAPAHAAHHAGNAGTLSQQELSKVFSDGDTLSLLALPKTTTADADGLIVLLYGYGKLKGQNSVTGVTLMNSARQSGIRVDRIDRVINAREAWYNAAGNKRGRKYTLNNQGQREAEALIRGMLA